ncbi:hypothetical protein D920_00556 [Enterococcus faecalis 13-SD-W-01]|nr:hypothetical protein D920_00556 [Enterococcus faecalis 13-SD-W-01]
MKKAFCPEYQVGTVQHRILSFFVFHSIKTLFKLEIAFYIFNLKSLMPKVSFANTVCGGRELAVQLQALKKIFIK